MARFFVYEPREDSFLLERHVRTLAHGRTLDVGTGSGILAAAAIDNGQVTEVWAVDISDEATDAAHKRLSSDKKRIVVRKSDLFSELGGEVFDTILCNPPYLPDDPADSAAPLDGGPRGYEWVERFLDGARDHLGRDGQILIVFSSLTNKERVDALLHQLGYAFTQLEEEAFFFERLYAYRLWRRQ